MGVKYDDDTDTQRLRRALRNTEDTARGTSDRVDILRKDLARRIDQLELRVAEISSASARVEGKVDVLVETTREDRNERRTLRMVSVQAEVELEKTGEIVRLNEAVAVRADRRKLALKALAVIGPIAAAAVTWGLSRC